MLTLELAPVRELLGKLCTESICTYVPEDILLKFVTFALSLYSSETDKVFIFECIAHHCMTSETKALMFAPLVNDQHDAIRYVLFAKLDGKRLAGLHQIVNLNNLLLCMTFRWAEHTLTPVSSIQRHKNHPVPITFELTKTQATRVPFPFCPTTFFDAVPFMMSKNNQTIFWNLVAEVDFQLALDSKVARDVLIADPDVLPPPLALKLVKTVFLE